VRLVYYGTPWQAVPPLDRLVADGHPPLLTVTREDKPRGRGLGLQPSPAKTAALAHGIRVTTPRRASAPEEVERVRSLAPDLLIVVAYGQILSPELLAVPRFGALNVHFSLLPRHRGAAPVAAALLAGDHVTGVCTLWMNAGLDEGPVFLERATTIDPEENAGTLGERLAGVGAELLAESVDRVERGDVVRREQDPALATYAPKLRTGDARLDVAQPAERNARRVRAFTPEPGAWLSLDSGRLVVLAARVGDASDGAGPRGLDALPQAAGAIVGIDRGRGLGVACAEGTLWIERLRPEGRKEMSGADYANGARLRVGDRLAVNANGPGGPVA